MIRLALRSKVFPGSPRATLADLDLALDDGEFLALLGPSGVGKTTLLRILAGLDVEFSGDRDTSDRRVGYIFQEPRLMPWLTAEQNVALVVEGDTQRARSALEAVQIPDAAGLYPHQLSGGMQRRVALARAMVCEPRLLLLDEPFVSLDQPSAEQLQALLLAYWERERPTVVLVSHNLSEAIALADQLLFLGGSPARVIHRQSMTLPRPRRMGDPGVRSLRDELLERYPTLLAGTLGGDG